MFVKLVVLSLLVAAAGAAFARPSDGGAPPQRYVVRPGDTLWGIAERRYGGDVRAAVWRLRERNGVDAETLEPGETLVLP